MAKERGWWDLDLHDQCMQDLSDADREHIAQCIIDGCTGGEIVQSDTPDWDSAEDEQPSDCPDCGHVNEIGETCKKCGHEWKP